MKWSTTAVLTLATRPSAKGQHDINPRSRGGHRGQNDDKKNKFFLKKEDVKDSRGRYTWKPRMTRRSKSFENEETQTEKSDIIGILSNDKESIASVVPQEEIVLSVSKPQDVEDHPAQAQGRRLDAAALQAFKDRCYETSELSSDAYVNCVEGLEVDANGDLTGQTCEQACGDLCCTGAYACDKYPYTYNGQTYIIPGFTGKVCKDMSCNGGFACFLATIPYVVGPSCTDYISCGRANIGSVDLSCTDRQSCRDATIGSAVSSCNDRSSCRDVQIGNADSSCNKFASCADAVLSNVDLINSCNKNNACQRTSGDGVFDELIDCCNDEITQCQRLSGFDIVNAGCPNAPSEVPSQSSVPSESPSSSSAPSQEPSPSPSQEPSGVPSQQPSESSQPSLAPSNSPRVTSLTVVEPDGVSKTVNCCENGDDNNECQSLLAVAEAESLDECVATSTSEQPSLVPSTHPSAQPSIVPSESFVPSLMPSETPSSDEPTTQPNEPSKTGQEYLEDALQSLPSASGKGGKGKTRSAQRLIVVAIESNNVFEKISKALSASETLGCDNPQEQDEDTCEQLSLAISDFALNGFVPNDVPSSSKGSKGLSNTMSNNSSSGKGKESPKFDSINMSSMTEVWEYSTSDWSLDTKKKALVSTVSLASIILKEMMDYEEDDELN